MKIRFLFYILIFICLHSSSIFASEEDIKNFDDYVFQTYSKELLPGGGDMPIVGIFRGIFSYVQTPAEIVRWSCICVTIPEKTVSKIVLAPITVPAGAVAGSFALLGRCLISTCDIISLGTSGAYTRNYPPFIWDAEWTSN